MKKQTPYQQPTEKQVKDHWQAQKPSVFRKPHSRDKGLTIVNSPDELSGLLNAEIEQGPQRTFRMKTPPNISFTDPTLHIQNLIRMSREMTADEFKQQCNSPMELALYEYLYSAINPNSKAMGLLKLQELLFRAQQEANKQINVEAAREERKEERLRKMMRRMKQIAPPENNPSEGDE
ncbi:MULTISPECIES: hypothetical protein [unclassified Sphingopyxis]|uniref:hypothetical protein n=1 Tax=unclassified Sphingopyxis TaxID=2614943 RepID=UPI0012E3D895|nr:MULTISPECIES: hypothetical protein [unclassified Sphingopyxis]